MEPFAPGQLWARVQQATERAKASGHLHPIPTTLRHIVDGGIEFSVRVVQGAYEKPRPASAEIAATPRNPFLPYDPELFVADISASHVALLNKFVVVEHHLLMVTREFRSQTAPAEFDDWHAVARCLLEYPALAFYNAGTTAGASQPHRHWQQIPWPTGDPHVGTPIDPLLPLDRGPRERAIDVDRLPWANRWWRFSADAAVTVDRFAAELQRAYVSLAEAVGWSEITEQTYYNLLIAREWMMLVPRRQECFAEISFNAMAFVGGILVHNEQQFQQLADAGPCRALAEVAPRE